MAATKQSQAAKAAQVAEVRRMLTRLTLGKNADPKLGWARFDGRIGYVLSLKGVTKRQYNGWGMSDDYVFNMDSRNRLAPPAREWIEANGMKDLADAYDIKMVTDYINDKVGELNKKREKIVTELEKVDRDIARLMDSMPQASAAATAPTGERDDGGAA